MPTSKILPAWQIKNSRNKLSFLFQTPRTSKRRIGEEEVNVASLGARFRNILSTVQACGDYDRLQQGVFENYLNIKFKDSRMENVWHVLA